MDDLDGLWALADTHPAPVAHATRDSGGFGGLDLSRDCEDSRAPFSGDKFSAGREVAKTEGGFSFLEVQQAAVQQGLRESELKSQLEPFSGSWNLDLRESEFISAELACSAYASPSTTRWVRNCNGGPTRVPVRSWPVSGIWSS
jgi:hypothetical protein